MPPELLEAVELLVSEVVTNAVVHARTDCHLRVEPLDGARVRIKVKDGTDAPPALDPSRTDAVVGRGLTLVDALADRWGYEPAPSGGKVVWFEAGD